MFSVRGRLYAVRSETADPRAAEVRTENISILGRARQRIMRTRPNRPFARGWLYAAISPEHKAVFEGGEAKTEKMDKIGLGEAVAGKNGVKNR